MQGMNDGSAIVFDPEVGQDARQALTGLAADGLLIPYRGPVQAPAATEKNTATPVGCGIGVSGLAAGLAVLGTSVQWSLNILIPVSLCAAAVGTGEYVERRKKARRAKSGITWHRRYVRPRTDIDVAFLPLWDRAIAAAEQIAAAEVVATDRVDSARVIALLPHQLWEIAERLARLTEARDRQREILGDAAPDDPDLVATVAQQRAAQDLAAADATRRVERLEAIARLLAQADLAVGRETVANALADLNAVHAELLAGAGETEADMDLTERVRLEAQAVIDQAQAAARHALGSGEEESRQGGE
jgi:hypothetical protein